MYVYMIKRIKKLYNKYFNKDYISTDYLSSILNSSSLNTELILENNIILYVISINTKEDKAKVIIKKCKKEIQV